MAFSKLFNYFSQIISITFKSQFFFKLFSRIPEDYFYSSFILWIICNDNPIKFILISYKSISYLHYLTIKIKYLVAVKLGAIQSYSQPS